MRRFVSGLCLSLMFLAVSLAQTAWWLSHTVFDTGAFRDAVRTVAAQPAVRAALGEDVAGAVTGGHALSAKQNAEVRSAVDASVGGQQFADALADTLAGAHAALLAGRNPATALDLGGVQADVRRSLAATDPKLAAAVPAIEVKRPIDPGHMPWVPRTVDAVGTAVPLLVAAALCLLVLAVLVARNRPRTMRRAGYVLLASTVFTLVTRFVVPALAVPLLPAGIVRTLGGAIASYFLGALVPALAVTAAAAVVLVVAGFAWGRARARPRAAAAAPAQGPVGRRPVQPAMLPVAGPPIANPAVVSPAPLIAPARRTPGPATAPPTAADAPVTVALPASTPTAAAETVEDPGGWGPLRY